jgi:hypothetical protein
MSSTGTRPSAGRSSAPSAERRAPSAERRRLGELAAEHAYPADVLREIGHELDLEESRLR